MIILFQLLRVNGYQRDEIKSPQHSNGKLRLGLHEILKLILILSCQDKIFNYLLRQYLKTKIVRIIGLIKITD